MAKHDSKILPAQIVFFFARDSIWNQDGGKVTVLS